MGVIPHPTCATLFSISSITCSAFIFLSVSELLQVLTINQSSLWMPKVGIFASGLNH